MHDRDHSADHLGRFVLGEIDRDVNALAEGWTCRPLGLLWASNMRVALFHRLERRPILRAWNREYAGLPGHQPKRQEMSAIPLELGSVGDHRAGAASRPGELRQADREQATLRQGCTGGCWATLRGRVEHLFLLRERHRSGTVDGGADLLNTAAVQTLRHGGKDVQTLSEKTGMPSGGPICAIFRYGRKVPNNESPRQDNSRCVIRLGRLSSNRTTGLILWSWRAT